MIVSTIDTNVLASGFVRANAVAAPVLLIDAWLAGVFTLAISEHIVVELRRTFRRPYFAARLSSGQQREYIVLLGRKARILPISVRVTGVATHPEDDLVLATAVSADADYLVTGDRGLQEVGSYGDVSIVSPRRFVDILATASPTADPPADA